MVYALIDVLAGDPRMFGTCLDHEFPPPRAPRLEVDESADGLAPVVLRNKAVGSLVEEDGGGVGVGGGR